MLSAAEILGLQLPQAGPVVRPGGPATQALGEQDPALRAMAQPAKSQEEVAQRVQGWQAVLTKVQQDPNLMRALGLAGAYLLQPIPEGQTAAGHLGRAFMFGNAAYGFGEQAQQAQEARERELARKEAESQAVVRQQEAATRRTEQLTPVEVDRARKELERLDAVIAASKTQQERDSALLEKTKLENALMQRFGEDKFKAEIATSRANAEAAAALAEERRLGNAVQRLEAKVASGTATPEEAARYAGIVDAKRKSGSAVAAGVQTMDYLLKLRKMAHPNETDAQRAAWLLEYQQTSKTDPLRQAAQLEELAAFETDPARRTQLLQQADALRNAALAPATPGAAPAQAPPVQRWIKGPDGKPIMLTPQTPGTKG